MKLISLRSLTILMAISTYSCEPVLATPTSGVCQEALAVGYSAEYAAGLTIAESLGLESFQVGQSTAIVYIQPLNRAVLMMNNQEMHSALKLLLLMSNGHTENQIYAKNRDESEMQDFVNLTLFTPLTLSRSIELFGGQSDLYNEQTSTVEFGLSPQEVLDYDFFPKSQISHLAIYLIDKSLYIGPAQFHFPEPEEFQISGPESLTWDFQPELPKFYHISNSILSGLLKAWMFR